MAAIRALQQWCKIQCEGYRDVKIINMTTSFRDGLAFCAIIHKHRPDLIDFESLRKESVYENNHLKQLQDVKDADHRPVNFNERVQAFRVAEEHLGIPALLDAEDMVALSVPDRLSILTYVSQYYNYFNGRSPTGGVGGVGGVKRPAEGSKEEPSEKKNLPVVAKTYSPKTDPENRPPSVTAASKTARENRVPSLIIQHNSEKHITTPTPQHTSKHTHTQKHPPASVSPSRAKTSPKPDRVAEEKTVLVESSNKTGTLNSKCAVCRTHVHLVQRHLVDGKLYHRSCFKCSECSSPLQSGAYKAGQEPVTLLCSSHRCRSSLSSSPKSPDSDPHEVETGLENGGGGLSPSRHVSVLSVPIKTACGPPEPCSTPQPWTSSAQRTQVARRNFFLSKEPVAQAPASSDPPVTQSSVTSRSEEEKERARAVIAKKLAEGNCNNNNKAYSSGLRAGSKLAPGGGGGGGGGGGRTDQHCTSPNTSITSKEGSVRLSTVHKESHKPAPTPLSAVRAKDATSESSSDWQLKRKATPNGLGAHFAALTPERNKISFNSSDDQLKHHRRPSVPTFQPSNTTDPTDRLSPKSPATDPPHHGSSGCGFNNETPTSALSLTGRTGSINTSSNEPSSLEAAAPVEPHPGSARWAPKSESSIVSSPSGQDPSFDRSVEVAVKSICRPEASPFHKAQLDISLSWRDTHTPKVPSPKQARLCLPAENGSENGNVSLSSLTSETKSPASRSHHIPTEQITKELQEIEDSLNDLEKEGIELERRLRRCEEEGSGDILMDPLMVDWFNLIRKKESYVRRESELMYIVKTQDLEEQQPGVEGELRRLINKPEHLKSAAERKRESDLMKRLVEIVNDRNALVEGLEEDRLREEEEDQQLNTMMQRLGLKKRKSRRTSSFSKLFRRRSNKALVEE